MYQIKELKSNLYREEEISENSSKKTSEETKALNLIYVYNRDKSILYYFTKNKENFLRDFKINSFTFKKHLEKGTYYLGRYLFTNYLIPTAKNKKMTLGEFVLKLEKDRENNKKSKKIRS